jgi:glutathione peroxidase
VEAKPKAEGVDAMREKLSSYGVPAGAESDVPWNVLWNFEKFVVGRSGEVIARFSPDIVPEDPGCWRQRTPPWRTDRPSAPHPVA